MILPWFGGSSSVWSVCLVFFPGRTPARVCLCALAAREGRGPQAAACAWGLAAVEPGTAAGWRRPRLERFHAVTGPERAGRAGHQVGAPYLLLSTTGPLMQTWYARCSRVLEPTPDPTGCMRCRTWRRCWPSCRTRCWSSRCCRWARRRNWVVGGLRGFRRDLSLATAFFTRRRMAPAAPTSRADAPGVPDVTPHPGAGRGVPDGLGWPPPRRCCCCR